MKICIYGAGAVGGYLAACLVQAKVGTLTVIARGAHKEAIERHGLRLDTQQDSVVVHPDVVSDQPTTLEPQDLVFVTVKTTAQPKVVQELNHLLGATGYAVFAANGIPWWWKAGSPKASFLPLLDPEAQLWNVIGPQRSLGCVVYSANEVIAPGRVRHLGNNRWIIGEAQGGLTPRLQHVVSLLQSAGVGAEACEQLRTEIWIKLLRNASINSLCALTRLPVDGLASDPELLAQADALVEDIVTVAAAQGMDISSHKAAALTQLRRGGAEVGTPPVTGLRPSMLQDTLAERGLEVEAVVGQVQALAREVQAPCPAIDAVLPILRGLNRSLQR